MGIIELDQGTSWAALISRGSGGKSVSLPSPTSRDHWHSLAHGHSSIFNVSNHEVEPSSSCSLMFSAARKGPLHLKTCIDYIEPTKIIQDDLPFSLSSTSTTFAKPLLPWKLTYSQVQRMKAQTSLGAFSCLSHLPIPYKCRYTMQAIHARILP